MVTFFPFSSAIDLRRKSCSSLGRGCEEPISSQAATRDCAEVFRALLMLFLFVNPDFGSTFYIPRRAPLTLPTLGESIYCAVKMPASVIAPSIGAAAHSGWRRAVNE